MRNFIFNFRVFWSSKKVVCHYYFGVPCLGLELIVKISTLNDFCQFDELRKNVNLIIINCYKKTYKKPFIKF